MTYSAEELERRRCEHEGLRAILGRQAMDWEFFDNECARLVAQQDNPVLRHTLTYLALAGVIVGVSLGLDTHPLWGLTVIPSAVLFHKVDNHYRGLKRVVREYVLNTYFERKPDGRSLI